VPITETIPSTAAILQNLIRFDTTNPPGNEAPAINYIASLFSDAGLEAQFLALKPDRPNLVVRLPGQGEAPPLLLYGHTDVVTTSGQNWTYPPFEGVLADGCVWGRGALDMKGGLAMMLSALLRLKSEGVCPPGDIQFTAVTDEENLGAYGAGFLVERHAGLFSGVKYALGEFGGFTFYLGDDRFYPIMIAEKQCCWIKAIVRGPAGHGSIPVRGGAMARMGRLLQQLDRRRLPVHITPPARMMVEALAEGQNGLTGFVLRQLLNPIFTNRILDMLGERGRIFDPLLHNTVSPTMLQACDKINVIPGEVSVGLDGRLLPGFTQEDMLCELRQLVGEDVELNVESFEPGPVGLNMGFFDQLASVLRELDPAGKPIPLLLSGVTDARFFSKLGIQTYGFLPMKLAPDFIFTNMIHAADERIPVEALEFGAEAIYQAVQRSR
jgi:acetylornithine deacetylase/succinyl-diaminopimelate desuccinylase-like protein